jgi:hypothetical protein
MSTGTGGKYSIGGSEKISGWVFGAGGNFGVTKGGILYAKGANISGYLTAEGGTITNLKITDANIDGTINGNKIEGSTLQITNGATLGNWEIKNGNIYGNFKEGATAYRVTIGPKGIEYEKLLGPNNWSYGLKEWSALVT